MVSREYVRVLIDEGGDVVDLVVDHDVEVLLGVVGGDLLEGEFLVLVVLRHDGLQRLWTRWIPVRQVRSQTEEEFAERMSCQI